MLTPVVVGVLFGTRTLAGVLAGALVSGVQMAVSMSNTGSAWITPRNMLRMTYSYLHMLKLEAFGMLCSQAYCMSVGWCHRAC